jgi:predicted nucleic acid-binding protein
MIGNKVVLDSNILILASKQELDISKLLSSYEKFYVSIVTYIEVLGYKNMSNEEIDIIKMFFNNIEIIDVDFEIAKIVITYKTQVIKKIKLPDAIILATAKHLGGVLLTRNTVDFTNIDEKVRIENI